MKNFVSKSVTLIMIVAFLGCSSDSSNDSTANCTPLVCKNAGISNSDCGCICPDGYGGSDCSTVLIPTKIFISKIRVLKFPNDGGGIDDLFTKPDLFISLNKSGSNVYTSPSYFGDANGDGSKYYDFIPSTPIETNDVGQLFTLSFWDYDSADDLDLMATKTFSPYFFYSGFPASFVIEDITQKYTAEIFVIYQW